MTAELIKNNALDEYVDALLELLNFKDWNANQRATIDTKIPGVSLFYRQSWDPDCVFSSNRDLYLASATSDTASNLKKWLLYDLKGLFSMLNCESFSSKSVAVKAAKNAILIDSFLQASEQLKDSYHFSSILRAHEQLAMNFVNELKSVFEKIWKLPGTPVFDLHFKENNCAISNVTVSVGEFNFVWQFGESKSTPLFGRTPIGVYVTRKETALDESRFYEGCPSFAAFVYFCFFYSLCDQQSLLFETKFKNQGIIMEEGKESFVFDAFGISKLTPYTPFASNGINVKGVCIQKNPVYLRIMNQTEMNEVGFNSVVITVIGDKTDDDPFSGEYWNLDVADINFVRAVLSY